jgi:hypothetical protein
MSQSDCKYVLNLTCKVIIFAIACLCLPVMVCGADPIAGMSDPMRPMFGAKPVTKLSKSKPLELQSTLVAEGRKLAVINGQTFAIGDRVRNARIMEIKSHQVILKKNNSSLITLRMLPERVVTKSTQLGSDE